MSFDGLFTRAMVHELSEVITGGRINRVHQPFKNELLLVLRTNGQNHKLLLSVHPSYARAQLTEEKHENPNEAPMFCMLLRKHIEGFILEKVVQPDLERVIIFEVKGRNELGDLTQKQLIIEIMGKHSNIILVDKERNLIIDCIKHVPPSLNSYRTLLPGNPYVMPPAQHKQNPFDAKEADFYFPESEKIAKQIVGKFSGISPLLAKELVGKAEPTVEEALPTVFMDVMSQLKKHEYKPTLLTNEQKSTFYMLPITHIDGRSVAFGSLSQMLDRFYFNKADRDRVKQQAHDLERFLQNELEKNEKKITKLEATLVDSQKADQYKKWGELLTANLYALAKGMKSALVTDYYDETEQEISIDLDERKTPSENAQAYFLKYQKAKNAKEHVHDQLLKTAEEITYLETIIQQLQNASPKDLLEIREELEEQGYIKTRNGKKQKQKKTKQIKIEEYYSSDRTLILVGKNNKQNEYLSNKLANRHDWWFHAKDIPGSHVVIRSENPSEQTINEAAMLAAYFSKARLSSRVPVDATLIRHVKKPAGAKPGYVTYDNQRTYYVTPTEDGVIALRKQL